MPEDVAVGTTANPYKGYVFRIGGPRPDGKIVQVWSGELITHRATSIDAAMRWVDQHGKATADRIEGRDRG